jgi:hypothetical protein
VSLRGSPIERSATLPDGREVRIRVGVPEDPYIAKRDLDTVDVELFANGEVLAAVNTVLGAEQHDEAVDLAHAIAEGLEAGTLAPTAAAIEPLADEIL